MPIEPPPLLILGASTRAAAQSAARAGFAPLCADVFADDDLRDIATVEQVSLEDYPEILVEIARRMPAAPWVYTGAMENYPDIVARISESRPLWGNPADAIRRSRDPFLTYRALHDAGLPVPRVRSSDDPPPADGRWMLKPERSGGGRGIRVWDESAADSHTLDEPHWFQERAGGLSLAAIFVAFNDRTLLAGVTRQLVGNGNGSGPAHGYTGSIGPHPLPDEWRTKIAQMGEVLSKACGLRGIFGVDFLLDSQGAWPVDLNPRYTASVEVVEHIYELPLLHCHAAAFRSGGSREAQLRGCEPGHPRRFVGKSILFTEVDVEVPPLVNLFAADIHGNDCDLSLLADRPAPGSRIAAGKPLCSVIVSGRTDPCCRERLGDHVRRVRQAVFGDDSPVEFR